MLISDPNFGTVLRKLRITELFVAKYGIENNLSGQIIIM